MTSCHKLKPTFAEVNTQDRNFNQHHLKTFILFFHCQGKTVHISFAKNAFPPIASARLDIWMDMISTDLLETTSGIWQG